MTKAPTIEFGRKYRDRITGFQRTCTGKASYISGCDQVLLAAPVDEKGAYRDTSPRRWPPAHWFDDERLIDVESEQAVERTSRRGGPQQEPTGH